jgi:hypothetical protein
MPATGKVVLDTSAIVAALRRAPGVIEQMRGAEELLVPLVALGELEYGANLATPPERRREAVRVFMEGATLLFADGAYSRGVWPREACTEKGRYAPAGKRLMDCGPRVGTWFAAGDTRRAL